MNKDYYSILNINKSATQEDIKKAYYKLAKQHHPDKETGNSDRMSDISTAYSCLSDPEKREYYDQFGQEQELKTKEDHIKNTLLQIFMEGIGKEVPSLLTFSNKTISNRLMEMEQQEHKLKGIKKKLIERRKKIKIKKDKENLIHMVIDQQLSMIDNSLVQLKESLEIHKECLERLKDYSSDEQEIISDFSINDITFNGQRYGSVRYR